MTPDKNQTESTTNIIPDKKSGFRKYKVLMILGTCLAIAIGLLLYNRTYLTLYYIDLKYNPFHVNDKLYANEWYINKKSKYGSYNLDLYRKIRPLNNDDIDAMNISLAEKALIKSNLSTSNKPALTECAWSISSDSLRKYKTACIGNYTGSEILSIKIDKKYYPMLFFSITTNKKALLKKEYGSQNELPPGYVYDDGPFYVRSFDVTQKEVQQFGVVIK